jgi:hypothetical protein
MGNYQLAIFKYAVIVSAWRPCKFMRQKKYHKRVFALSQDFIFTAAEARNLTTKEPLKAG